MSTTALTAAADLRSLRHADRLDLTFASLLLAPASRGHDVPVWRSLSNLIGAEWADQVGLASPTAWWAPRRSDARQLAGRTMSTGSTVDGGNLAISSSVNAIAAATRPATVLERIGAIRTELPGRLVDAVSPQWAGGSGYWVAEGADVGDAGLTVTSASAAPRTAGASITLSRRLTLQAEAIEQQVAAEIQRQIRVTIETAFLNGTGSNSQPLGLVNTPGTGTQAFSSAGEPTFAELVEMVETFAEANGDLDAARWILHPSTFGNLLSREASASTGVFVASGAGAGRSMVGIPAAVTSACPAGKVLLLDPRNVEIYYWRSPQVIVNRYIDNDYSGATRITVLNDCGMLVQRRNQLIVGG